MNTLMKSILFFLITAVTTLVAYAQDDKADRPSPPAQATATVDGTTVTIEYSQPSVKGREIFGGLEPYGKVWRTGANEATTFEVSSDVTIEGQTLPKGKYALFTIPQEDEDWTVIFNKTAEQWGAFKYDESEDALRVQVSSEESSSMTEKLTFDVAQSGEVSLMWADTKLSFDVASDGQAKN